MTQGLMWLYGPAAVVTFDAAANSGALNNIADGATASWSHTAGASATYAVVVIADNGFSSTTPGVTFGGITMTFLGNDGVGNGNHGVFFYGLGSPPTGAQTVVATFHGGSIYGGAASFTLSGATSAATITEAHGAGLTASLTVTTAAGQLAIAGIYVPGGPGTTTSGTEVANLNSSFSVTTMFAYAANGAFGWTQTSGGNYQSAGIVVSP